MAAPAESPRARSTSLTPPRVLGAAAAVLLVAAAFIFDELRAQFPRTAEGWLRVAVVYGGWYLLARFVIGRFVKQKALRTAIVVVPMAALTIWAVSPAFIDKTVNEEFPGAVPAAGSASTAAPATTTVGATAAGATPATTAPTAPTTAAPLRLRTGTWKGIGHTASGAAALYRLPSGEHLVRLEEVDIQNGPDLFVYLVPRPGQENDDGGVNLGRLKGNRGNQNYAVPADVDPSQYSTVLIWCRMFAVPFANATLAAA